ncbi:hypothetical protein TNCT_635541 [Trichonephila clavata]|uniref:Uncharacterized protein n=1 Tax=Trichonephila clavata TaxID=2740835 RepID=A0A8X6GIY5_TRICU|nr:hypothetical protein TNCT_635541 [Trichonephila clavata]
MTSVDKSMPIVHSLVVWKMCEVLDLKAKFVPLSEEPTLPGNLHRGVDRMTSVPVVGSLCVWNICHGSSCHLRPTDRQNNGFSKAQLADSSGTLNYRF